MSRMLTLVLAGVSALALSTVAAPAPASDAPTTTAPTTEGYFGNRTGNWCC